MSEERLVPRYPEVYRNIFFPEAFCVHGWLNWECSDQQCRRSSSIFGRYPRPWRAVEHDNRVYIEAANGRRVCEVQPGQLRGDMPTHADALALAEEICKL